MNILSPGKQGFSLQTKQNKMVWDAISDSYRGNLRKAIRPLNGRGQDFQIIEVGDDFVKLRFSKSTLKLDSWRFLSVYQLLRENQGRFKEMGSNKSTPKPGTIERHMKEIDGNMNGLMTTLWVSTILVKTFREIEFVPKPRYALRMRG
jgi:hypothetical protein